jgi:rRNA maturation RNase YbeY
LQETEGIEADIFISVERVEENAKRLDISSQNELARVMAHGLLHLIGFKDKEAADKKEMTGAENKALELFLS